MQALLVGQASTLSGVYSMLYFDWLYVDQVHLPCLNQKDLLKQKKYNVFHTLCLLVKLCFIIISNMILNV